MGSFVKKATVRITVPEREGEYIEIKAQLSVGEKNRVSDALMAQRDMGTDDAEVKFRFGSYNQILLETAVVGWRLLNEESESVPFKRELIADLDPEDDLVDKVLGEIATRYPLLGKRQKESKSA